MATRSRLGRDPLDGMAKPAVKKTAQAAAKPKTPQKTVAKPASKSKAATSKPAQAAAPEMEPSTTAPEMPVVPQAAMDAAPVAPRPIAEEVLLPETPRLVVPEPAGAQPEVQPVPQSTPVIEPAAPNTAAASETVPESVAEPEPAPFLAEPVGEPRASASQAEPEPAPSLESAVAPEPGIDATSGFEAATAPEAGIAPVPETVTAPQAVSVAGTSDETSTASQPEGPHPAEVFLSGVLEGLTLTGGLLTDVEVDPATSALPVEKLFYFSHVLQLLVSPQDMPVALERKPGDKRGPVPTLSVLLRACGNNRYSLRIYDNGLFFGRYLPDVSLDMEALRPLMLFVIKRGGSICLKQGKYVEFEIFG